MAVDVAIDSRLRVRLDELPEEALDELQRVFTHTNPEHFRKKAIDRRAAYKEPKEISTWEVDEKAGVLSLPRGGTQAVREVLGDHGLGWNFRDERSEGREDWRGQIPRHEPAGHARPGALLWDHQREIVEAVVARENCIARAPTGSGKTTAAIAGLERLQVPGLVIVWNGNLFRQWQKRLSKELGLRKPDIGLVGDGKFKLRPVTIAMQQTLWRLKEPRLREVNATFGAVVCDELQRFAARTFRQSIDLLTARYRIGISADETRRDGKEFLIYDMFAGVAIEVSLEELIERGIVHDVVVRVVPTGFRADWYGDQRDADDETPDFHRLLDEMGADPDRNGTAMNLALAELDAGHQVVMFSHRREHCATLQALAARARVHEPGLMLGGKDDADETDRVIEQLIERETMFAAGTVQAVGTGLDLPAVSRGVMTTPIHNNRQLMNQVRGRLCRKCDGKRDAALYYLWDVNVHGMHAVKQLNKHNRTVLVLDGGDWVPADRYIKENRRR